MKCQLKVFQYKRCNLQLNFLQKHQLMPTCFNSVEAYTYLSPLLAKKICLSNFNFTKEIGRPALKKALNKQTKPMEFLVKKSRVPMRE